MESSHAASRTGSITSFKVLMALMNMMKMCLIHPSIPLGREATIRFSPSRKHLLKSMISKRCVFCVDSIAYGCSTEQEGDTNTIQSSKKETSHSDDALVQIYSGNVQCGHYAHRSCLVQKGMSSPSESILCPRCAIIGKRLIFSKDTSSKYPVFCKNVEAASNMKGIQASSKVLSVINWISNIPRGEKAIVYSFFKSSL